MIGVLLHAIDVCNGHGRLIEPPSRSSAFRYGFQTPPNYNDHELYCGGFARQQRNGGKCGECGDPWDVPQPRPNEHGGKYGQGVIVRKYNPGSDMTIRVELTASHMGYFEFRLCPNLAAKQDCLDKHLLELLGGTPSLPQPGDLNTRFYPRNGSRIYDIKARLPEGLECGNCVLQWRYIAGNNWGMCDNGTGAVGCGPQEEFRACSDISIGEHIAAPPLRPIRPGTKPTKAKGAKITDATKTTTPSDVETFEEPVYDSSSRYLGAIVIILSALLVVLCLLFAIYLYHYHGSRVKQFMHWNQHHQKSPNAPGSMAGSKPVSIVSPTYPPPAFDAPVPPPRQKRLSQTLSEVTSFEPSLISSYTR